MYKSKEYNGMDILDSIFSDQRQKDMMNLYNDQTQASDQLLATTKLATKSGKGPGNTFDLNPKWQ
jgi:hypothetical protein